MSADQTPLMPKKAILALADGRIFHGFALGAEGEAGGEVVFNTSMTGYQEIITDPSYRGQLVTMTYPLIGNTGVNSEDVESRQPFLSGFVVREYTDVPSNWRASGSLQNYLVKNGVVGIQGLDTRALTKHIRDSGAQQGVISSENLDEKNLVQKAKEAPSLTGRDLVSEVSCEAPYEWTEGGWGTAEPSLPKGKGSRIIVMDFGLKETILRSLVDLGCRVTVVPAKTSAEEILSRKPDGILLSNGPGDPEGVPYAVETVRELLGLKPIFGICLGHQIIGLALGGKTYKLKFGHHGGKQPVMDLSTKKVEITSQNHGFAMDVDSIGPEVELTHINLNDRTVEGMRHKSLPVFSVQYHPESSPGPHDSRTLFNRFLGMVKNG